MSFPTKEAFVKELPFSAYEYTDGVQSYRHAYPVAVILDGEVAMMSFVVPADFRSIVTAEIIIIPNYTKADYDIWTESANAGTGEDSGIHTDDDDSTTYDLTADEMSAIDVSGILTELEAGDIVGIAIYNEETGLYYIQVLGVRFKYNRR